MKTRLKIGLSFLYYFEAIMKTRVIDAHKGE